MRLLFLGTGPSVAIPRKGHRDVLCRAARRGGKSRRSRSAALIFSGQTTLLIDSGPDIKRQLAKARPDHIDAVFLTHGHEDAVGGLSDLDAWLTNHVINVKRDKRETRGPVPVFTDPLTAERLTSRFGKFTCLKFEKIKNCKTVSIGHLNAMPFPVWHARTPDFLTYGYKFDNLAYASDFYELPEASKKILAGLDTLILDGAMYMGVRMPTHLCVDKTIRLAAELRCRRLIVTQSGHTYPPHEQALREMRRYLASLGTPWPKQVDLAFDGMKITTQSTPCHPERSPTESKDLARLNCTNQIPRQARDDSGNKKPAMKITG